MPDEIPPDPTPAAGTEPATPAPSPYAGLSPEALEQRLQTAEARTNEVVAAYRQLKVETEAYRERLGRDIERRHERKRDQLLIRFIEIVDNLERALDAAQQSGAHTSLIEGLILVRTQLVQILQDQGLTWIPVRGLPFDPECSEVVDMDIVDDPANDQVVMRELQRGYRLNGRIVRHAQVVVGQYHDPSAEVTTLDTAAPAAAPPTETAATIATAVDAEPSEGGAAPLHDLLPPGEEPPE